MSWALTLHSLRWTLCVNLVGINKIYALQSKANHGQKTTKKKFYSSKNFALQREKVQGANSLIQWSSSFPVTLLKVEPPGSSQLVNFSTEPAQWLYHCTAHDQNTFITAVIISNSRLYNRGWGKYTVLQDSHMIHQIRGTKSFIHCIISVFRFKYVFMQLR